MKTITLYREDFKESQEANFFNDILESIGIPETFFEDINIIELKVDENNINLEEY